MAQETMLEQIAKSEASARTANSLSVAKTNSELAQIAAEARGEGARGEAERVRHRERPGQLHDDGEPCRGDQR